MYSLSAGGRQNVLELMDWWELVPDVDHNRCIIKHSLWFSLRILNIFGNKGNICLIFLSFTGCYIFWTDFLNWGPYFCGILRSTSSNVLHSKILACLIPFHLLNGFIVSYIPARLSFGSEKSHVYWIKLEPPHLLWFQDCEVALQPESPRGGHSFPAARPVAVMAETACDTVLAG